ncbi:MAG: CoA transferase [Burkholderiaceae bacterium]|nr:CoA transferase [Burkholderiaceae bacterium]
MNAPPLAGLRVLDFCTLLPGPLAGLMLAEAGAEVTKVERPGAGDEMRAYPPPSGGESALFAILNRGKRSLAIDLKQPDALATLHPLLAQTDILIEQFRPGVMDRLGLGYETLHARYPRLIYCSVTGFGQDGPRAQFAGHDLNYLAISGLLSLSCGSDGAPTLPVTPIADIAGGSYPAFANVLLALLARERGGQGCHLDISMTENLFTLAYWGLAQGFAAGDWPGPASGLVTGASPRYQIFACADGEYLAAAPIEERFWTRFCELIGLDTALRAPQADAGVVTRAVATIIGRGTGAHWRAVFDGQDVCCCVVNSLHDAVLDAHFQSRGVFDRQVQTGAASIPALPTAVARQFRSATAAQRAPRLGEHTDQDPAHADAAGDGAAR